MPGRMFSPEEIAKYAAAINQAPTGDSTTAQASPQEKTGLPWGYKAGLIGSQLFDAGTTQAVLANQRGHEANPVPGMKTVANNPALMYAMKGGLGALGAYGLNKVSEQGHPKLAKGLSLGLTSVGLVPGMLNLHQLSKR